MGEKSPRVYGCERCSHELPREGAVHWQPGDGAHHLPESLRKKVEREGKAHTYHITLVADSRYGTPTRPLAEWRYWVVTLCGPLRKLDEDEREPDLAWALTGE